MIALWIGAGLGCVMLAATVGMDAAPDAYEQFAAGGKIGKIVLVGP